MQDIFKKAAGRAKQGKSSGRCHRVGQYVPACITGKLEKGDGPHGPFGLCIPGVEQAYAAGQQLVAVKPQRGVVHGDQEVDPVVRSTNLMAGYAQLKKAVAAADARLEIIDAENI